MLRTFEANTKQNTKEMLRIFQENTRRKIYTSRRVPGGNSIFKNWGHDNYEYADFINLNDFLKENNIKNTDILKIDTEGSEPNILSSIKNSIKKISVIYVEYHSESQGKQIQHLLSNTHNLLLHRSSGYEVASLKDSIIGRINLKDIVHNGNTIISNKQIINTEHVIKLREIGYSFIDVVSKDLGEMCFLNSGYERK